MIDFDYPSTIGSALASAGKEANDEQRADLFRKYVTNAWSATEWTDKEVHDEGTIFPDLNTRDGRQSVFNVLVIGNDEDPLYMLWNRVWDFQVEYELNPTQCRALNEWFDKIGQ